MCFSPAKVIKELGEQQVRSSIRCHEQNGALRGDSDSSWPTRITNPPQIYKGLMAGLIFRDKQVWSKYSDLTRPISPKWWFSKGHPLISGKTRLVKYYNLARSRWLITPDHKPGYFWEFRFYHGNLRKPPQCHVYPKK